MNIRKFDLKKLETKRLKFTPITEDLFLEYKSIVQDKGLMAPYFGEDFDFSNDLARDSFRTALEVWGKYGFGYAFMADKSDPNQIIGMANFRPRKIDENGIEKIIFEYGLIVKEKFQKKGYGTEATFEIIDNVFQSSVTNEIVFEALNTSLLGNQLLERLGAKKTKRFRPLPKQFCHSSTEFWVLGPDDFYS